MLHPSCFQCGQAGEKGVRNSIEVVFRPSAVRRLELLEINDPNFGMFRELIDIESYEMTERSY